MRKGLSTRLYVTTGLASMLATVLFVAIYLGFVPDRDSAVRDGRASLAEAIGVTASTIVLQNDLGRLRALLSFVAERNKEIVSIGVRRADGTLVATIGDHAAHWRGVAGNLSTDSHVQVPIWAGNRQWGTTELRFAALASEGWIGYLFGPRVQMILFVVLGSAVCFYVYLRWVLRQLDPSRAIPGRVRAALDTMAEGLLVLDLKGHVVLANQAFSAVVGSPSDSLIGRTTTVFRWLDENGEPFAAEDFPWAGALIDGEPRRNVRVGLEDGAGKLRWFMVNCSPVLGPGGKPGGVLISLDDVTELEQKQVELRLAKDDAEAANRAKSDFLASMSHEIRTPMNAILGFTDVLRRGYKKGERDTRRHLDTVHASGRHLLGLIDEILDLSKIESGRIELDLIRCEIHRIVQEVADVLQVRAQEKGVVLRVDYDGPIPATILGDPTRLRQIVTNLTGNALKFTERGAVTITLRLQNAGAHPTLVIAVADTGIGIPADKLESIFEAFVQAEASTTRRFGGTGLGLAISRRLARAMGGDVVARSAYGEGSVFTVTLDPGPLEGIPLLAPHEAAARVTEPAAMSATSWTFPPSRILVVDDAEENRELLRLVLEEAGLEVATADNGLAGLERAANERFDLVLMDMEMPLMDGFTATRRLREAGVELPIFALTAHAMQGFEQPVLEAGCTGYLTKPIDIDALLKTLAGALGGTPVGSDDDGIVFVAAPPAEPEVETTRLVSRLAAHPRLGVVVRKFVETMPQRLAEMDRAEAAGDWEALAVMAHTLRGAGGSMGFDDFTEPSAALEQHALDRDRPAVRDAIARIAALVARLDAPVPHAAHAHTT